MCDIVVATMTIEGFIDNAGINVKISPYVIKKYKTKYQSCFNLSKYINEKIQRKSGFPGNRSSGYAKRSGPSMRCLRTLGIRQLEIL